MKLDDREKGNVYTMFSPVQPAVILLFLRKASKLGRIPAQVVSEALGAQWGTEAPKQAFFLL